LPLHSLAASIEASLAPSIASIEGSIVQFTFRTDHFTISPFEFRLIS
jgi:hypothetical protein